MDYKVLYRKYRPSDFNHLVGQNSIKKILVNSIINDKIAHAYIFTGPRGTGKTSTAKIFARALNCLNPKDGISCGECENCKNVNQNPDIIELDAASNNSVDDIRNIVDSVNIAPTNSKYKIYIIDEVHMLSTSAWNAFLKTLEEPPHNVIFILATTEIQKVPITVLSRCQRFDFQRIDRNEIKEHLNNICKEENIKCSEDALTEIAFLSDGCMRDALSILDQLSKISDEITIDIIKENYGTITDDDIENIYVSILHNDLDNLLLKLNEIKMSGIDIKLLLDKMIEYFLNKAISFKQKGVSNNAFKQLRKIINSLNELLGKINSNSNGFLMLELELISFINDDEVNLSSRDINQIISREIISKDMKVDVNNMLTSNDSGYYKVDKEFIDVRTNNVLVNASKENKIAFIELWKNFYNYLENNDEKEFRNIVKNSVPQIVSDSYALLVTKSESSKLIGNKKLHELEILFKKVTDKEYKFIFLNEQEWKKFLTTYDKEKKYKIIDESGFINKDDNSCQLAESIFGTNNVNME